MQTVRILVGGLNAYIMNGGSWDEANPDPMSFTKELAGIPPTNSLVIHDGDDGEEVISVVNDVVLNNANVYAFVTVVRKLS